MDAVYAFAHALELLHRDVCPKTGVICDEMKNYDGGEFYKNYLLNVEFEGKL